MKNITKKITKSWKASIKHRYKKENVIVIDIIK